MPGEPQRAGGCHPGALRGGELGVPGPGVEGETPAESVRVSSWGAGAGGRGEGGGGGC